MTTTSDIQVPGQLELPLEFEEPITKTVTYFETYTEVIEHTAILTVPARYKPLIGAIEADQTVYQRTLKSLVRETDRYDGVTAHSAEVRTIEEYEDYSDFRIR